MKFTVVYTRKDRTKSYSTVETGLIKEFDTGDINEIEAFKIVKDFVNSQAEQAMEEILRSAMEHSKNPKPREVYEEKEAEAKDDDNKA
jgi:inorganic triphosphatase YgiF